MNKKTLAITAVAVLTAAGLAFAQMDGKGMGEKPGMGMMGSGMMKGDMMDKGGMMGKGMMDGKMMGMMGMCPMMKTMMDRTVVPTSDGGIIIVLGNKITKYDKDLNVIKEIELKMDMEGMQKMMDNMKSMCPMMGKGMMGGMDKDSGAKADSSEPAKEVDHASHH